MNITQLTLTETLKALEDKEFSLEELNEAYLQRIEKYNPVLNAYLYVNNDNHKIPAAIKDVISTKDIPTTASSKILEGYMPPYDATVMNNLFEQGVGVIGKTNNDEFAMGSSNENSAYGPVKNPWDISKVPGGSSGGSAAAVAANMATFALGSDTGGSIRQPASLCGIVGFKPTYGTVSRYGLIAMASSLDQIGPMTKSVEDAAVITDWLSGPDGFDSNCNPKKWVLDKGKLKSGVKGLRVGVPKRYFKEGLDKGVEKVIRDAVSKLEELGAEIVEMSLPNSEYAVAVYYIIMASEVSSNLARFDGLRFGKKRSEFGAEVKRRIMLGTYSLSSGYWDDYYAKAAKIRTLIKEDFEKAFEKVDVLVGPVSPTVAWDFGAKTQDPLAMYLSDIYTIPANLAGIPAISVPAGFSEGLPVGLHIQGKFGDDNTVLQTAYAYEQATDWHQEKPVILGTQSEAWRTPESKKGGILDKPE
ncbi:MAG: Asp-tRNA(Asn)/Glu-tRNA(Gln) amidotransferase subunit GatA [Candidatus Daviesbacteria bacterium]|nr:Asp-tRNA(Asn)/Glu-tRNA(Gln) amidotransferase subunit GatA [Candidatus Daviesbacteria bacterium]